MDKSSRAVISFCRGLAGGRGAGRHDGRHGLQAVRTLSGGRANDKFRLDYESVVSQGEGNQFLRQLLPDTVQGNVKNVQGWRGGAERGFLAEYPDLVHMLSKELAEGNESLVEWTRKVLTHNLSISVLGQRVGLLVPITYRHLKKDATKEEMRKAHLLGWGVEILRASTQVSRDTMVGHRGQDDSVVGQGAVLNTSTAWPARHGLREKAFNDAMMLQCAIHKLLQNSFKDDSRYRHYVDTFNDSILSNCVSNLLSFKTHPSRASGLASYTMKNYKALVRNNVANASYCLPVSLALHMAGLNEAKWHRQANAVFNEIGYFADLNRDYANCFRSDDCNADIREGRLTWLIVMALQRAKSDQKATLERCYGTGSEDDANTVRGLYDELKLAKTFRSHVEEKHQDILQRIQGMSSVDGLSPEFFFKLIDSLESNKI